MKRYIKIPLESGIKLDHLKDFNTLRRILTPLVQLYHGVGFDTRLTYDEFSIFFNDLGYEEFNKYSSGIQEWVEVKHYKRGSIFANSPITLIIERQSNPLPFLAYTHPQPP